MSFVVDQTVKLDRAMEILQSVSHDHETCSSLVQSTLG